MVSKMRMRFPARIADGTWKEALPIGNGITGALLLGAVGGEVLLVNRCTRWEGGSDEETIPDVSGAVAEMRRLQKEGRFSEANGLLSQALSDKGYHGRCGVPSAPAEFKMEFDSGFAFRDYSRGIDLTTGEASASFTLGGARQTRRAFVSRVTDCVYCEVCSETAMDLKILPPTAVDVVWDVSLRDGQLKKGDGFWEIGGCTGFLLVCSFGPLPEDRDYDDALKRHVPLHRAALGDASLDLGGGDSFCDSLLDEVFTGADTPELYEKLWYMGRYLFVCGTAEDGLPFPLYGLWHGTANPVWSQHVANENVQMIYWHALTGGCADLIRPLIHYYYGMMDTCREAARKLFGARGIFVSVYTTPVSSKPAPNVPVIVNYIGCAGWLSGVFYDYYRYTGDRDLLEKEILPFMLEAAAFYEDYAQSDDAGALLLSPSVSPENTPGNLMPSFTAQRVMGHPCPAVSNATMDVAILKELLTNLLELGGEIPLDPGRTAKWRDMLSRIPAYRVNRDGAVAEWMDERLEDNYRHRHLSHLYPLFPGHEVRKGDELFGAFEKAVDLRQLGSQSGWSLAHMAGIYDRLGRGDRAAECLHTLARSCLLGNFMTQHNDWRGMGLTLYCPEGKTIQLDALMGAVNAVQEMLLRADRDAVYLLPALPAVLRKGRFRGWHIPGAVVDAEWDADAGLLRASVTAKRSLTTRFVLPDLCGGGTVTVSLRPGETAALRR